MADYCVCTAMNRTPPRQIPVYILVSLTSTYSCNFVSGHLEWFQPPWWKRWNATLSVVWRRGPWVCRTWIALRKSCWRTLGFQRSLPWALADSCISCCMTLLPKLWVLLCIYLTDWVWGSASLWTYLVCVCVCAFVSMCMCMHACVCGSVYVKIYMCTIKQWTFGTGQ